MGPALKHVLIVEDVDEMLRLLELTVSAIPGLKVTSTCRNTWETRLELTRRMPAIVLLDEILPGESGLDLLKELVSLNLTVVLLTGNLQQKRLPLPPGAIARLTKPGWGDDLEAEQKRFADELLAALAAPNKPT
ncbi:response regulator [bacterium]|jgi:response regulator of citrate/malate metabolism|nr:response regulator [bacterium]